MSAAALVPTVLPSRPRAASSSSSSSRRPLGRAVVVVTRAAGGAIRREVLSREERTKIVTVDDANWYALPRLVTHVDDEFLAQLTQLYRERVPTGARVLDMCSSWVSHLPEEVSYEEVVGHGMNIEELSKNPRLDRFFVRNLNESPGFAAKDNSFDAVLCCVSVQYLQRPEEVFAEVYRVLKPGGVFIVSFSNRQFYEKAIRAWRDGSGYSRAGLVKQYFDCVEGFTRAEVITEVGVTPDDSIVGKLRRFVKRSASDPFYAVVGYRNFQPIVEDND